MTKSSIHMTYWQKGEVIEGRYRIVRLVGQGGMGVVYAVEDLKLEGSLRAMKVTFSMPDGSGAYSEEANTLMKLNHPCLPLITDYFLIQDDGIEVLVMDYIEGETIAAMLAQPMARFTFAELIHIGLQLCSALKYLHSQARPIIHRDLKPSNVMIDCEGYVKLIDFGISRRYKEGKASDTVQLGTLGFAAPEQYGYQQSDSRTDIYGLGALLYYMAAGGGSNMMVKHAAATARPFSLNGMPKEIPIAFHHVLDRMLQRQPEHRYQTMSEVELALKSLIEQERKPFNGERTAWGIRIQRTRPAIVTVLSLTHGAGATFLSIAISALLGRQGYSVTAAEYYSLRPEWNQLLPMQNKEKITSADGIINFTDKVVTRKAGSHLVNWLALNPHSLTGREQDEHLFEQKLRQFSSAINIIDLSGQWHEPHALYWLKQSQHVLVIADPFVAKWQMSMLQKLLALQGELREGGGSLHWIANKDARFRGRREWLSLFPERPLAAVPLLPQEAVLNAIWSRRWLLDHKRLEQRLYRALLPIFSVVCSEVNTK